MEADKSFYDQSRTVHAQRCHDRELILQQGHARKDSVSNRAESLGVSRDASRPRGPGKNHTLCGFNDPIFQHSASEIGDSGYAVSETRVQKFWISLFSGCRIFSRGRGPHGSLNHGFGLAPVASAPVPVKG